MKPRAGWLFAVTLSQFPMTDQFGKSVDWAKFESVPIALVFAGKEAALEAKSWGIYLQETFNPKFVPHAEHLRALLPTEAVKVVAVATLPEVPAMFRFLFRSGFRSEAPNLGMALDFESRLSGAFGYSAEEKVPLVAIVGPGGKTEAIRGLASNEKARERLASALRARLARSPTNRS